MKIAEFYSVVFFSRVLITFVSSFDKLASSELTYAD